MCLPDGIPRGRRSFVLREDSCIFCEAKIAPPAAAVFEEAARLSYQFRQLWPKASALTPKVPAHTDMSLSVAQTHRLPNRSMQSTRR
jgi:hypothetical protein